MEILSHFTNSPDAAKESALVQFIQCISKSDYESYENACESCSTTDLKVGGIVAAKTSDGYKFGIFGGKDEIISARESFCPLTGLEDGYRVQILNHKDFMKGTGIFNSTQVKRMGFVGDVVKTRKKCYEQALSLIGQAMYDDELVELCRFDKDNILDIEEVDSSGLDFLGDL